MQTEYVTQENGHGDPKKDKKIEELVKFLGSEDWDNVFENGTTELVKKAGLALGIAREYAYAHSITRVEQKIGSVKGDLNKLKNRISQ